MSDKENETNNINQSELYQTFSKYVKDSNKTKEKSKISPIEENYEFTFKKNLFNENIKNENGLEQSAHFYQESNGNNEKQKQILYKNNYKENKNIFKDLFKNNNKILDKNCNTLILNKLNDKRNGTLINNYHYNKKKKFNFINYNKNK